MFISSVSHRLDPGATQSCSFPCLQLHNCIQRSSLGGNWGVTGFSGLAWGFLFPAAPPVVCFAPVLSSPTRGVGDCLILVVETLLADASGSSLLLCLPAPTHVALLFQLHAAATTATLEQIVCSVTGVIAQRGKIPLRFAETQHAAPAAGSGPVPTGGQETAPFRPTWCFVKLSKMGACSAPLVCPLTPRQDKLCLNLSW